ncbi:MAG: HAD family hydrolase [Defluviitaleaceae bacterium]|nr:HAD family hydrolase [Defluviitaleaceae bacterium]
MKHSIKMIVTDLDGTLLRTDKTLSMRTKAILRQSREKGIKIVYATGRGGSAERVAPSELFDGKITMNGAVAKVADTVLYERLIPYQTARPFLMACDKRGIKITSEINGMHYSNFAVSDFWPLLTTYEEVDFEQHKIDAEKIYSPNPDTEEELFIKQHLPDDLYSVVTSDATGSLLQVMHKDAAKSKAVAALAKHWNIASCEIVAFGDDRNDIDMLSGAGIGVAMAGAIKEVKAVSNYICGSNDEDGLAKWIEENIA